MHNLTAQLTFFLAFFSSFLVTAYYFSKFIGSKKITQLSRSLSFFLFFVSSGIALFMGSPNPSSLPIAAIGMVVLYGSLVFDEHSSLRYSLPLPFIALFLFKDHQLLLVLSLLDYIAILELAFHNGHKKMIPFISAFTLVVVAEYFYVYGAAFQISLLGIHLLYLFASFVFVLWILFQLIRKTIRLLRNED